MLKLVIFPLNKHNTTKGFTLLELVVVLAILAMVGSVVMPNTGKVVGRFQAAIERDDVLNQLADLGIKARQSSRLLILNQYSSVDNSLPLQLPEGWSMQATEPIVYHENGFCDGGELTIFTAAESQYILTLQPPYCQPVL